MQYITGRIHLTLQSLGDDIILILACDFDADDNFLYVYNGGVIVQTITLTDTNTDAWAPSNTASTAVFTLGTDGDGGLPMPADWDVYGVVITPTLLDATSGATAAGKLATAVGRTF